MFMITNIFYSGLVVYLVCFVFYFKLMATNYSVEPDHDVLMLMLSRALNSTITSTINSVV